MNAQVSTQESAEPLDAPEVMVLLSGGADSSACVAFYREAARPLCAAFINYQQGAVQEEAKAAQTIASYYGIPLTTLTWKGPLPKTVGLIPGRNLFLLAAALMERPATVTTVALGIHAGTPYDDCSPRFINLMQSVFDLYSNGRVHVAAPFLNWSKADIWAYSQSRHVPLHLTYSCERGGTLPCGKCASCLDREALHASTSGGFES